MNRFKPSLMTLAFLFCASAWPAWAESSASSAVSDSTSTSIGSLSDSIRGSSNSSSGDDRKVADGDYQVVELAQAPEQPGVLRVKLQAVAGRGADGEFFLLMPQETAEKARLEAGQVVAARQRPYGLEFAKGTPRQAFFLVLADAWYRELQTHVVRL
ncbi:MAG: hypothetical protein Q8K96_04715 [Rubrivivax sp.]|nr:hypothetical protein [Rubrivivax sp.]